MRGQGDRVRLGTRRGPRAAHLRHRPGQREHDYVFWHHGTPNIGAPPRPLLAVSDQLGVRWVSNDRPGYGGSTPVPGRTVGSAAADVAAIADALGIERFAVMGHSGGSPHALGCAALLPDRVFAVVAVSGLAPYPAEGLDWFASMAESGLATLSAAVQGRAAKEQYEASEPDLDPGFTAADDAASSWRVVVVHRRRPPGHCRRAWTSNRRRPRLCRTLGFRPSRDLRTDPVVHGQDDRIAPSSHAEWLATRCPSAELWLRPGEGHISVMSSAEAALRWLVGHPGPMTVHSRLHCLAVLGLASFRQEQQGADQEAQRPQRGEQVRHTCTDHRVRRWRGIGRHGGDPKGDAAKQVDRHDSPFERALRPSPQPAGNLDVAKFRNEEAVEPNASGRHTSWSYELDSTLVWRARTSSG